MNFHTSLSPDPCLSEQDEEYLRRNGAWADRSSYLSLYSEFFICLVVIGIYLWYLRDGSRNPNFSLLIEILYNYGWLIVIPVIFLIFNLSGIIIKHTVDAIRKRRKKC
jgi:hypothetical protein